MFEGLEKPEVINTDKLPTYGIANLKLKAQSKCPEKTVHRQIKYVNNVVETNHGKLKQLLRPVRDFRGAEYSLCDVQSVEVVRAPRNAKP